PVSVGRRARPPRGPLRAQARDRGLPQAGGPGDGHGAIPLGAARLLDRGQRLPPPGCRVSPPAPRALPEPDLGPHPHPRLLAEPDRGPLQHRPAQAADAGRGGQPGGPRGTPARLRGRVRSPTPADPRKVPRPGLRPPPAGSGPEQPAARCMTPHASRAGTTKQYGIARLMALLAGTSLALRHRGEADLRRLVAISTAGCKMSRLTPSSG